ncbi:epigen-like [Megalops cyprinoides]|uniref:epigen-like n=1 Tax=Megalops cyprinoides TaxID=118141 RepID=UPI0018644309|nr:epigen-like [Megalops cyprinoides]
MHQLQRAIFTLTVTMALCWTLAKAAGLTESPLHSTQPTREPTPFSSVADSEETPRVLKLLRPCSGDDQGFCMNGQCSIHPDLNTPVCSCPQSYTGERCQHLVLDSHGVADPEKLIAIGVAVALLLCGLIGALYCCVRKRCEKQKPYQIHSDLAI